MTALEHEPRIAGDELQPGVVSTPMALEITSELRFNDWKRLGEQLAAVSERALWALGDWRAYGDRFEADYADALAAIDRASETARRAGWVARAFSVERRRPGLHFSHHQHVASLSEAEQDVWLNEAERQGWNTAELRDRLAKRRIAGPRPPALSLRPVGDVVVRFEARAAALGVPARSLALEVLELASQLDDPVGALEAAGAKREIEAAA